MKTRQYHSKQTKRASLNCQSLPPFSQLWCPIRQAVAKRRQPGAEEDTHIEDGLLDHIWQTGSAWIRDNN